MEHVAAHFEQKVVAVAAADDADAVEVAVVLTACELTTLIAGNKLIVPRGSTGAASTESDDCATRHRRASV